MTATNAPADFYWPEMVMDATFRPGQVNTLMGSMGSLEDQQANVDQPEVLREPSKWNYRAGKTLGGLVTAAHRRGRCAFGIDAFHLERADRDGRALVSDVVHSGECRR